MKGWKRPSRRKKAGVMKRWRRLGRRRRRRREWEREDDEEEEVDGEC